MLPRRPECYSGSTRFRNAATLPLSAYRASEGFQETHEASISMPRPGPRLLRLIAEGKRFSLHFQVDLRIDMGGIQGDMAQPCPNGVDVHARTKQMDGTGVPLISLGR